MKNKNKKSFLYTVLAITPKMKQSIQIHVQTSIHSEILVK